LNIVIFLLYLTSVLLIWQFIGYPLFMAIITLKSKKKDKDYDYKPFVSIIVPTYNEEKNIKDRLQNLLELDYPKEKYEVIFVESGSTDKTYSVLDSAIKEYTDIYPKIKLIKEDKRRGKASAIILGKKDSKADIILVTDSNSIFEKNVLKEMMPYFKDEKVGAVGGRYMILNPENRLTSAESFYWDMEYIMRKGESLLDSACLFHGEINAWRKELVKIDDSIVSEDLDTVIQIRKSGYKIEYEPEAIVYEKAATTPADQIKQRKRNTIGTIKCIFKHWKYFLFPKDLYSLFIFPSHKTLTIISPFLLLFILILYLISRNIKIITINFITTITLFLLLLSILIFLKSKIIKDINIQKNFASFILSIPKIVYYVLLNEYLLLLAWRDFVLKRYSVLWEKIES